MFENSSMVLSRSKAIAITSIFSALTIASTYATSFIPNVEPMSFLVFVSGFLFGYSVGVSIGLISMTIYTSWNPWGPAIPIISLAQIGSMAFIGFIGGIMGRNKRTRLTYMDAYTLAITGGLLTIFYDLVTTLAMTVVFGVISEFPLFLVSGALFTIVHVVSNILIFGFASLPVINSLFDSNILSAFFFHEKHIMTNGDKNDNQ